MGDGWMGDSPYTVMTTRAPTVLKIIFQNRYVALETPPFKANTILDFHFDYSNTSLIRSFVIVYPSKGKYLHYVKLQFTVRSSPAVTDPIQVESKHLHQNFPRSWCWQYIRCRTDSFLGALPCFSVIALLSRIGVGKRWGLGAIRSDSFRWIETFSLTRKCDKEQSLGTGSGTLGQRA